MPLLSELGAAVRRRRQEIGLSQEALARIAGLSRATITNLENGSLENLGSTRIERLANTLGFAVGLLVPPRTKKGDAIAAAAGIASVPYKKPLPPEVLRESLTEGIVPPGYIPHLRTLLQEAPVAALAAAAEELEREYGVSRRETWARMRAVASVLKSDRPLWTTQST